MENIEKFRIPATEEDARQLKANRATLWPSMLACICLVAIVIALLMLAFGWLPVLIAVLALGLLIIIFLVVYGGLNGMDADQKRRAEKELPGCDIFDPKDVRVTGGKVYEFDCAPSDIFPYFRQFNLIKAGYYSFDWLERFFGFHIVNDYTIRPEWQSIASGDWIYYHQNGAGTGIVDWKDGEYITTYSDTRYKPTQPLAVAWRPKWMDGFAWTWNFIFEPIDGGERTRFTTYLQAWWPKETKKPTVIRLLVEWGVPSNVMMNGMASKVRRLAERDAKARRAGLPRPGYNYTK